MPTNRFKIYSYPYLSEGYSDYKNSIFHIEGRAEYNHNEQKVVLGISYNINNDYINGLIGSGDVKVSIKISCKFLKITHLFN